MHTSTIKCAGWTLTALLAVLTGCHETTTVATPAAQVCRIQAEITNGGPQGITYTYNDLGQLIKLVTTSSSGTPVTQTYTYDTAGRLTSSLIQGTVANSKFTTTGSYEYSGSHLIKIVSNSSNSILASTTDTYSYDERGQLATYSYTSSDAQYGTESYTFTNGLLTGGTINRAGQSLTVKVDQGRIVSIVYPDGRINRYTYDDQGYSTRADYFDKAGKLQSYTVNEYSTTAYKRAGIPYWSAPAVNLYGKTELPLSRVAVYDADGSLKAETRYQYQVNSNGYITNLSYTQNQPGVGNSLTTSSTTYTYSNCP